METTLYRCNKTSKARRREWSRRALAKQQRIRDERHADALASIAAEIAETETT
jgi:hypothetical protein